MSTHTHPSYAADPDTRALRHLRANLPTHLATATIVDRPAPRVWIVNDDDGATWMVTVPVAHPLVITLLDNPRARLAYRCVECGRLWTVEDDPNEWAYGHDCEA